MNEKTKTPHQTEVAPDDPQQQEQTPPTNLEPETQTEAEAEAPQTPDPHHPNNPTPENEPDSAPETVNWQEIALRARAELENYRKRMTRERTELIQTANQSLLEELLPVLDHFGMGMQMAAQEPDSMVYKGMEMVQRQLLEFLENQGLKIVDPTGAQFDPNIHEAVAREAAENLPEGSIVRVTRVGYELRGRLIRPANVVVATTPEEGSQD